MADSIGTYRAALADILKSAGDGDWSEGELDSAIRLALMDLSHRAPRSAAADLTLTEAGRRISLESVSDCEWVEEVWWPYAEGMATPRLAPFAARDGCLDLFTIAVPQAGDTVHVLYAGRHSIAGLDGAPATTVPSEWRGVVVLGAAGYAAAAKAAAMAREYAWPAGSAAATRRWSEMMLSLFEARLGALRTPAVQAWVTWG